jgi:DNA-binding transcriptional LysR family regulator
MQLEREIRVLLLERTKRHVRLTPAGKVFYERARQVLSLADQAGLAARRVADGLSGSLEIAFVGSAMFTILPEILREARLLLPEVVLHLREMTTEQQVNALAEANIQVAVVRVNIAHPPVASIDLCREELMIALPASHRLADAGEVPLSDLEDEPFILFSRRIQPSFGHHVFSLCVAAGFTPRVVQEALEMQTVLGLVGGDLGVTVVPASVRLINWPGVVFKPIPSPAPQTQLYMAYRSDDPSPVLPRFLEIARSRSEQG